MFVRGEHIRRLMPGDDASPRAHGGIIVLSNGEEKEEGAIQSYGERFVSESENWLPTPGITGRDAHTKTHTRAITVREKKKRGDGSHLRGKAASLQSWSDDLLGKRHCGR